MDVDQFAKDLKKARAEITLQDLTDSQWDRVCNRIANCLNKQGLFGHSDLMTGAGGDEWKNFINQITKD